MQRPKIRRAARLSLKQSFKRLGFSCAADEQKTYLSYSTNRWLDKDKDPKLLQQVLFIIYLLNFLTIFPLPFSSFLTQSVTSTTRSSPWLNGSLKTLNERKSFNWKSLSLCKPGNIITPAEQSLVCWFDSEALQIQFISPNILSRGYRASGF